MFTFHPGGLLSEAIAFKTHARISHVQMVMDVGINGTIQVVSAEAQGLIEKWVIPETVPWYCILSYEGITFKKRDEIAKWMWDKRGTPYDVWGLASFLVNIDLNDERKSFCSEVNFQAYEAKDILLFDGVDHAFVSPRDLYILPTLRTLDGSRKEIR
jgi:uncharacterized protein YycO